MTDDQKPQGTVQIALRISPDLRERVKAAAEANNRSVNSELTATLEEKYPPPAVAEFEAKMRLGKQILDEANAKLNIFKRPEEVTAEEILTATREAKALLAEYRKLFSDD